MDHVIRAASRDVVLKDLFHELSMGIDDGYSHSRGYVPSDYVSQERAFPRAGRAEDGDVFALGFRRNHEHGLRALPQRPAKSPSLLPIGRSSIISGELYSRREGRANRTKL